jgi:vitamin B12/bleomycin/antimicrobial peptide transport system ATP-binding/permease protein
MHGLKPFLTDAWRLALPYFRSEERWSARGLLGIIIVMNLALVGMNVVLNFWNREFFNALQNKDWDAFIQLLFFYRHTDSGLMPGFVEVVVAFVGLAVCRSYLQQWLQIRWRRWMTGRFLDHWLTDQAYYRLSLTAGTEEAGTENPDQRISEDLRDFVNFSLALSVDFIANAVSLVSFLGILWSISGPLRILGMTIPGYMVWVALLYAVAGTWLTHLVGRPLFGLNFLRQRVEADFRFALVRLRENVEGIALYNGEEQEKRGLVDRFGQIIGNWHAIMKRTLFLNTLIVGYNQIANIFPLVVGAPRYFAGIIPLGGLTQIADAFGQVQGALSWFISNYADTSGASIATWRATTDRLTTFKLAIDAAQSAGSEGAKVNEVPAGPLVLKGVTLAVPDGTKLIENLDLAFRPGQSAVVVGRSGSGKSTLVRAIAGIWPFSGGRIERPVGSLFLPQRPYIPLGTLRQVVAYPESAEAHETGEVEVVLRDAGLARLIPLLDQEDNWALKLSGGEQQRLAIARVLLAKPDWLFLDEATANLDPKAEASLYRLLRERLPGTTIISVAHRPAAAAHHERRITFERDVEAGGLGRLKEGETVG